MKLIDLMIKECVQWPSGADSAHVNPASTLHFNSDTAGYLYSIHLSGSACDGNSAVVGRKEYEKAKKDDIATRITVRKSPVKTDLQIEIERTEEAIEEWQAVPQVCSELQSHYADFKQPLSITDWRDLRVGDIISYQSHPPLWLDMTISDVGEQSINIESASLSMTINPMRKGWRFISRPN